jgi:hypothetical protein
MPSTIAASYRTLADLEFAQGESGPARKHIAEAYSVSDGTVDQTAISQDFHRIDPAGWQRVQDQKTAQAKLRYEFETQGMSADQKRIYDERGSPCHITSSDDSYVGRIEIWNYDCVAGGIIGKEQFEFVNGRLTNHMTL